MAGHSPLTHTIVTRDEGDKEREMVALESSGGGGGDGGGGGGGGGGTSGRLPPLPPLFA